MGKKRKNYKRINKGNIHLKSWNRQGFVKKLASDVVTTLEKVIKELLRKHGRKHNIVLRREQNGADTSKINEIQSNMKSYDKYWYKNKKDEFIGEARRFSYLLESTNLAIISGDEARTEMLYEEWRNCLPEQNCRFLRKRFDEIEEESSGEKRILFSKWLKELTELGVEHYTENIFEFKSEDDKKLFSNGEGYQIGDKVELLQGYWYLKPENGGVMILLPGLIKK